MCATDVCRVTNGCVWEGCASWYQRLSATCAILQGFDLWTYGITGYNYMISKVKAFALSRKAFALSRKRLRVEP